MSAEGSADDLDERGEVLETFLAVRQNGQRSFQREKSDFLELERTGSADGGHLSGWAFPVFCLR